MTVGIGDVPAVSAGPEETRRAPVSRSDALLHVGIGALVVIGVASPVLFSGRTFATDYTDYLWYVDQRAAAVNDWNWLSPFLHANGIGVFSPLFAFYAGPTTSAIGALADLLGGRVELAFDVALVGAFAAAYGGLYWFGRCCGLSRAAAHFPALCLSTSAYYATTVYGRGDIGELFGVSSACLLLGALTAAYRATHVGAGRALAVLMASAVLAGSHNITLLWASSVGLLTGVLVLVALRARLDLARVAKALGLVALGFCLDAWALLPDLAWSSTTRVAKDSAAGLNASTAFFDSAGVVFDPFRFVPALSTTPGLFVQAPDAFLAFGLLGWGILAVARRDRIARRAGGAVLLVLAGLLVLMLTSSTWRLPYPFAEIQFAFRLNSYVAILTAMLVLVVLRQLERRAPIGWRSRTGVVLGLVAAWSLAWSAWQLWIPNTEQSSALNGGVASLTSRSLALAAVVSPPESYYAYGDYGNVTEPYVPTAPGRYLGLEPAGLLPGSTSAEFDLPIPPGTAPIDTDIVSGPTLLSIGGGVRRIGRDLDGDAVIARDSPGTGPVRIVLEEADSPLLWGGRILTIASAIAAGVLVVVLGALDLRRAARARRVSGSARSPSAA